MHPASMSDAFAWKVALLKSSSPQSPSAAFEQGSLVHLKHPQWTKSKKRLRVKMSCLQCLGLITTCKANSGDTGSWKISRLDKLLLITMRERKRVRVGGEITASWKKSNLTDRQKLVTERNKKKCWRWIQDTVRAGRDETRTNRANNEKETKWG